MILRWLYRNCKFAVTERKDYEIKVYRDGKYWYTHSSRNKASPVEALNSIWYVLAQGERVDYFRHRNRNRYRFEISEYKPMKADPVPELKTRKEPTLFEI